MKKISKGKIYISLFFLILFVSALPVMSKAAEEPTEKLSGSITLQYVLKGVKFSLYQVAEPDGMGGMQLCEVFSEYPVKLEEETLASTLSGYVERDSLEAKYTKATDDECQAVFSDLTEGVYLILGENTTINKEESYVISPMVVSVPSQIEEEICRDVEVEVKYEIEVMSGYKDIGVLKVWKNTDKHPQEISVQLLKDGKPEETIVLNKENNWTYTWGELDASFEWSVVEKDVPSGYTVEITKEGANYIIINTAQESDTPGELHDSAGKLPQTGQLWWPVAVLIAAGLLFILLGLIRRKRENE